MVYVSKVELMDSIGKHSNGDDIDNYYVVPHKVHYTLQDDDVLDEEGKLTNYLLRATYPLIFRDKFSEDFYKGDLKVDIKMSEGYIIYYCLLKELVEEAFDFKIMERIKNENNTSETNI